MARHLGRYELLGKIAQGGMAEVWLARQSGPQGFTKPVVIKQLLPAFAKDEPFVRMFRQEARLAALINHPNVVHIYELGEDAAQGAFMAMEFIDGVTLKHLVQEAHDRGSHLPYELIARVFSDACAGLDFAHELKGLDGQPLQLVHRDISLDNILITYSGQVKIVDFGIAKAATAASELTQSGVFKGKLSYASPEYLEDLPFDRRSDVWALGVSLYWALTSQRPFPGPALDVLRRQIASAKPTPPRAVDPRIPRELEQITTRALAKDPNRRFQSARAVQDAIDGWLRSSGLDGSNRRLSEYMNEHFPAEQDPQRLRLRELLRREGAWAEASAADEETRPDGDGVQVRPPSRPAPKRPSGPPLEDILFEPVTSPEIMPARLKEPTAEAFALVTGEASVPGAAVLGPAPLTSPTVDAGGKLETARPRRLRRALVVAAALVAAAAAGWALILRKRPPMAPPIAVAPPTENEPVQEPVASLGPTPLAAPEAADQERPAGHSDEAQTMEQASPKVEQLPSKAEPPAETTAEPEPAAPAPVPVPVPAPVPTPVAPAAPVRPRGKGGTRKPSTGPGLLTILVSPWANVSIDGKSIGMTPLPAQSLAPGRHEVRLENDLLHVVRKTTVQIHPAKTSVLRVRLAKPAEAN